MNDCILNNRRKCSIFPNISKSFSAWARKRGSTYSRAFLGTSRLHIHTHARTPTNAHTPSASKIVQNLPALATGHKFPEQLRLEMWSSRKLRSWVKSDCELTSGIQSSCVEKRCDSWRDARREADSEPLAGSTVQDEDSSLAYSETAVGWASRYQGHK
jgi:hypothetical protein